MLLARPMARASSSFNGVETIASKSKALDHVALLFLGSPGLPQLWWGVDR
jgi:hypothetical protein